MIRTPGTAGVGRCELTNGNGTLRGFQPLTRNAVVFQSWIHTQRKKATSSVAKMIEPVMESAVQPLLNTSIARMRTNTKTMAATRMWIIRGISRHDLEVHPMRRKGSRDKIPSEEAFMLYARKNPKGTSGIDRDRVSPARGRGV